ncbi:LysR family transcriptional regulator [Lachnospiraceae bacterium LCP25S3_G4]
MTLQQLYYFRTIAITQHYRQAAEKLNISQPSLSRSMANLEEELGLFLFEKSGRNVILTKCGKIFLDHVNIIINDVEITKEKMRQLVSTTEGHIDIAYVSPLAKEYIPKLMHNFLEYKNNHNVTFTLSQDFTIEMIKGLKSNKFDVIFGSFAENYPELDFVPILRQEMVIIVSLNHPLSTNTSVDFNVFNTYPLITYNMYSGLGNYTRKILKSNQITPNVICEAADEYAIASLVEEGFGIALVANVAAIHQAKVAVLPLSKSNYHHTVYMAYHKNRYLAPAVKSFIEFVKATRDISN